jgi:hypothetical protein
MPRPATRANDDHHRRLLAGDPREFAGAVADFGTAIGVAFEAVLARDPVEQLLTRSVRLHAAGICAVGAAVAVDDVREYEPQSETLAQASRDCDRLGGTGGLVNSAHDGLHYRLAQKRRTDSASAKQSRSAIGDGAHLLDRLTPKPALG